MSKDKKKDVDLPADVTKTYNGPPVPSPKTNTLQVKGWRILLLVGVLAVAVLVGMGVGYSISLPELQANRKEVSALTKMKGRHVEKISKLEWEISSLAKEQEWRKESHTQEIRLIRDQHIQMLRGHAGLFVVRVTKNGHEAEAIINKQAAIVGKSGFIGLAKGTIYTVHSYKLYNDGVGRGIASDGFDHLFSIEWHPGTSKPPESIPGYIHVISGKKIGLGKPTSP